MCQSLYKENWVSNQFLNIYRHIFVSIDSVTFKLYNFIYISIIFILML